MPYGSDQIPGGFVFLNNGIDPTQWISAAWSHALQGNGRLASMSHFVASPPIERRHARQRVSEECCRKALLLSQLLPAIAISQCQRIRPNARRSVFERVVGVCLAAGLVGGEGFAVDASLVVADGNKQRSIPGSEWSKGLDAQAASRAAKEYLATLDAAAHHARKLRERARPSPATASSTQSLRRQ
jgi:hypothetical protein